MVKANYVDGFVLSVPKKNLNAYKKLAKVAAKVWVEHGALDYKECVGDDMHPKWAYPFPKLARAKPGEVVFFSYVTYKSKAHRNQVNAKVMKDDRINCDPKKLPFDCKKMAYGGFKVFVSN